MWNVQRVKYQHPKKPNTVIARQAPEQATDKAKASSDVSREDSETAKRDAQLAKTEIERFERRRAKLNAALERLEIEKNRSRSQSSHDGVRRIWRGRHFDPPSCNCLICPFRKSEEGNSSQEGGVEPETKPSEVIRDSAVVAPESLKVCDTASPPPELAQPSSSDAAIRASREEVGVSKTKGGAEEYVTLPI
jgi:hypothetical protein